jgi:ankyrin repeat protein
VHLCRSTDVLEALVAAGADVNAKDERGACPLQQMCVTGSDELVLAMIRAGADAKSCGPLQLSRSATITVALIEAGADPTATDHSGATALHRACVEGKPDVAHQLVLRGAAISASDDHGKTPMHYAVMGASIDCAKYLISCGADPGRADHCGTTPLHAACSLGQVDMAITLLRAGASPSAMDDDEMDPMDPLRIACDNNFPDEPLLAMLELVDESHIASHSAELLCALCCRGRFDTALLFAQRGADPFQTHPRTGSCAIKDACAMHGGSKFLSAFLTPDNARTSWAGNMTLLHVACAHRVTDAAALLVRLGADTRAVHTPSGKTPLQMAQDDQWVRDMLLLTSQ